MTLGKITLVINTVLCILSFILAVTSVISVIVSLRQNGKLIQTSNEQLNEMRKERELANQPILAFLNPKFVVEKPRLFYTPPEDEYSILSRYRLIIDIENISSAVAVNFVCTAVGILQDSEHIFNGESTSKRINILGDNKENIDFMFIEQKAGVVFNSLREENVNMLPQGELKAVFMNTSGGAFRMVKRYLLYPKEEDLNIIRMWHSIVSSAEVDYKEDFNALRKDKEKNRSLFTKLKEEVDKAGWEDKEVVIECVELDEFFVYEPISLEEYKRVVKECHFSKFVGRGSQCLAKKTENTK